MNSKRNCNNNSRWPVYSTCFGCEIANGLGSIPVASALSCGRGDGGAVASVIMAAPLTARPVMGAGAARRTTVSLLPGGAVSHLAVMAVTRAARQAMSAHPPGLAPQRARIGRLFSIKGRQRPAFGPIRSLRGFEPADFWQRRSVFRRTHHRATGSGEGGFD